ncbi:hypothetical protein [Streptomyces acidiscabies]|nr:hypothetical protein [Streptomyces acidiscabies]
MSTPDEVPPVRPAQPRVDEHAADVDTLVDLGIIPEAPPEPQPVQPA